MLATSNHNPRFFLYRSCAFLILGVMSLVTPCASTVAQGTKPTPSVRGIWQTSDGDLIRLEQNGNQVTSSFIEEGDCDFPGERTYYLRGKITDGVFHGKMLRCNHPVLVNEANMERVWETTFEARLEENSYGVHTIQGNRQGEYWIYDSDATGTKTNFRRDYTYDKTFSLTRVVSSHCQQLRNELDALRAKLTTKELELLAFGAKLEVNEAKLAVEPRYVDHPQGKQRNEKRDELTREVQKLRNKVNYLESRVEELKTQIEQKRQEYQKVCNS